MSSFETWQIILMPAQTMVFAVTAFAAYLIGKRQNEINKQLLDLNYLPYIVLNYEDKLRRFTISNCGRTSVFLYGTKLGDDALQLSKVGYQIPPGNFYFIPAGNLGKHISWGDKQYAEQNIPFEIYLESENKTKYRVINNLLIRKGGERATVQTQMFSAEKIDQWPQ